MVAQRDMRQCASALQANHARANAAQRKRNLAQVIARVFAVVWTPPPPVRRTRGLDSRGVVTVGVLQFRRRRGAQTADRPHRRGGQA